MLYLKSNKGNKILCFLEGGGSILPLSSGGVGRIPSVKRIKVFFCDIFAHIAGEDKTDGFCAHLDHPVQFLLTATLGFDLKESKLMKNLRISLNALWPKDEMYLEPLAC